MDVEDADLPDIDIYPDIDELAKPSRPELESSPRKTEEGKENEGKAAVTAAPAKTSTNSWLVFSGAANLFAEDDDDKNSSSSSISLPKIPVSGENENDDDVLQLDGSSFLDEHEALKTQEEVSGSPKLIIDTDEAPKKAKKKSKRSRKKSDGSDNDMPLKSSKKSQKKKEPEDEGEGELPDLEADIGEQNGGDVPMEEEEGESPIGGERKKSKRLSKKELQKMHSDAQRVLREAPVSIPIRRAEPLNLDDILQEVASINSEVKKMIEKDAKKKKEGEEKPPVTTESTTSNDVIVIGDDPTAELSNKAVKADDSDIELEIIDETEFPVPPPKKTPAETKPIAPGVAWLMQRFKRHNFPGKAQQADTSATASTSWNDVKGHLQEEMAALREKGLQDRIQRYKMENEEELGEQEPEEQEAEVESCDNSEDDSYKTISDDEDVKRARKAEKEKTKNKTDRPSINVFLDKEAVETGSEDEDYQPSEGHREEGAASTDGGSISSGDEKVRSGSESGDEGSDEEDSEEIESTSDEEEEILRSSCKKKKKSKKDRVKKTFDSDDEDSKNDQKGDDDLPELVVEERPVLYEEEMEESSKEQSSSKVDPILEPSIEASVSSVVMPPDMPKPNELFNIYNDRFDTMKSNSNDENGGDDNNMDDLLGLCTGPFLPVEKVSKNVEDEENSNSKSEDVEEKDAPAVVIKKLKHVYGSKSKNPVKEDESEGEGEEIGNSNLPVEEDFNAKKERKKERKKRLREFIEDEAELSSSDEEAGRISADEDEGSSDDDSYETDPEFEDEALAKLTTAQLQKQVESIHMRQVIDEDERDLLHLREAIIPDADLADAVGPRLRRFRWAEAWRDMGGTDLASQGENVHADDDYLGLAALDANGPATSEASLSSMWQKQRVERERWLQNQQAQQTVSDSQATVVLSAEGDTLNEKSDSDCQLVRFGISAMRKSSGSTSFVAANSSVLTASVEASSSFSSSIPRRVSHGSMLSCLQQKELDKIAQNVGAGNNSSSGGQAKRRSAATASHSAGGADPKPEDVMLAPGFKSRSSAGPFIVMSDESSTGGDRKRKFDNPGTASSSASKRGKQQQSSVFDFLS